MSASQIKTAMDSAATALGSGDYDGALRFAITAQGHLASIPSGSKDGHAGGSIDWRQKAQEIELFISNVRALKASNHAPANGISGGIQTSHVNYVGPLQTRGYDGTY